MKLSLNFCDSKNFIQLVELHCVAISLNRKVQFHCKEKRTLTSFLSLLGGDGGGDALRKVASGKFLARELSERQAGEQLVCGH